MDLMSFRDEFFFPIESYLNKFFDDAIKDKNLLEYTKSTQGYPKIDVYKKDNELVVEAALPGIPIENISVEFTEGRPAMENNEPVRLTKGGILTVPPSLTISGNNTNQNKDSQFYVKELRKSCFKRVVSLPEYIKDEPEASYSNGLLTLKWKIENQVKKPEVKRIEIKQS